MNTRLAVVLLMTVSVAGASHVAMAIGAHVQAPGAALAFEAASVKVNKSASPQGDSTISPGGRFTATNLSLQVLFDLLTSGHHAIVASSPSKLLAGPRSRARVGTA